MNPEQNSWFDHDYSGRLYKKGNDQLQARISFYLIEIEDMSAFWRLKIVDSISFDSIYINVLPEHFHMICLLKILKVYKEIL